jgi:hypothetical protein
VVGVAGRGKGREGQWPYSSTATNWDAKRVGAVRGHRVTGPWYRPDRSVFQIT